MNNIGMQWKTVNNRLECYWTESREPTNRFTIAIFAPREAMPPARQAAGYAERPQAALPAQ
jgi:hypothetical protein